jgi:hypothetical protein
MIFHRTSLSQWDMDSFSGLQGVFGQADETFSKHTKFFHN